MMGPFVPSLISDQVNLIVALLIGIMFGFILEQAGFSSAKRLVGLFYGYDFTVLRVFFSAAVTAALGSLVLAWFGLLDLSAIFVNPLWLGPAIVGGVVMGIGFILGGYCPGTSIAALSIGKVDAAFFVLGGVLGVFLFGAAYPWIHTFNDSGSMGPVAVNQVLGLPPGAFVLFLALAAVAAFVATGAIERKVAPETAPSKRWDAKPHFAAGAGVLGAALVFAFLPARQEAMTAKVNQPGYAAAHPVRMAPPDELAFYLMDRDPRVKVWDMRSQEEFAKQPLPNAINFKLADLFTNSLVEQLSRRHVLKIVAADREADAVTAARLMTAMGYVNVAALSGGVADFQTMILNADGKSPSGSHSEDVVAAFRLAARKSILAQIAEAKAKGDGAAKPAKKIKGGC